MSTRGARLLTPDPAPQAVPTLTDGVIFLRPLAQADAAAHLAGEDEDMARWLSGGRSTPETIRAAIERFESEWRSNGPRRAFGIFGSEDDRLIGFVEANLALLAEPGHVNISYGIFAPWRGRGLARRAIDLIEQYLRSSTDAQQLVLQIAPENVRSLAVAEKAGFTRVGVFHLPQGTLVRFTRNICR